MKEEWKFIVNSKIYQISNFGRVKSIDHVILRKDGKPYPVKGRILKQAVGKYGYCAVSLNGDIKSCKTVHRLLMLTFKPIENARSFDVNHKDGNKSNNMLNNLEWCTKKENMQHARENGLWHPEKRCGVKHPMARLKEDDVKKIKQLLKEKNLKQYEIAKMFDICQANITDIKKGRLWKDII